MAEEQPFWRLSWSIHPGDIREGALINKPEQKHQPESKCQQNQVIAAIEGLLYPSLCVISAAKVIYCLSQSDLLELWSKILASSSFSDKHHPPAYYLLKEAEIKPSIQLSLCSNESF